jgi:hypothetical protein
MLPQETVCSVDLVEALEGIVMYARWDALRRRSVAVRQVGR